MPGTRKPRALIAPSGKSNCNAKTSASRPGPSTSARADVAVRPNAAGRLQVQIATKAVRAIELLNLDEAPWADVAAKLSSLVQRRGRSIVEPAAGSREGPSRGQWVSRQRSVGFEDDVTAPVKRISGRCGALACEAVRDD